MDTESIIIAIVVAVLTVVLTAMCNYFQTKNSLLKEKIYLVVNLISEICCDFQNDRNKMVKKSAKELRIIMNEHSSAIDSLSSQELDAPLKQQQILAFLADKITEHQAQSIEDLEEGFDLESIIYIELKTDQLKLNIGNYFPEMEDLCKEFLNEAQLVFNAARKPISIEEILSLSSLDLTKIREVKNNWLSYIIENREDLVSPFKVKRYLSKNC